MTSTDKPDGAKGYDRIVVRAAAQADLDAIVALDERVTSVAKPEYWRE